MAQQQQSTSPPTSPSTIYPSFDLYPNSIKFKSSIDSTTTTTTTTPNTIASVGGAIVGAMIRGATAGIRSSVGAANHVTNSLATTSSSRLTSQNDQNISTVYHHLTIHNHDATPIPIPSNSSDQRKWDAKVDQIIHRFYIKTAQIMVHSRLGISSSQTSQIIHSRSSTSMGKQPVNDQKQMKRDKWFNLELEDPEFFRDELKTWKSTSNLLFNSLSSSFPQQFTSHKPSSRDLALIPVMIFETILDLQALPSNSILVLENSHGQGIRLNHLSSITKESKSNQDPSFQNIVLERWTVSLSTPIPPLPGPELPTVYRYCIVHFRALYSYCRTLPAWQLFKRLRKPGSREHDLLKIGCRLSSTSVLDEAQRSQRAIDQNSFINEIGIDQRLSDLDPQTHLKHFQFPSVQTPYGALHSQVTYRNQVEFYISDRETALSSKFMAEDLNPNPQADLIIGFHRLRSGYSVPNPIKTHQSTRPHDKLSTHNQIQDPISPKPSYGSLSSRHPLHPRSNSNDVNDPDRPGSAASSLTAAIRAAAESSPFSTPIPQHPPPTQLSQLHNNSSALTAKLVAKRQSLPPVLSNALPSPSSMNRGYLTGLGGRSQSTTAMTGYSPRQTASVLSSSPLSGPSSSIRMSSNRPLIPSSMTISSSSPLSPAALHSGSHVSLGTSASGGTGGAIGPRPMPTQPLSRRYSSSRHSRSYGQGSSGGTLDSSLSRRALLNSENSIHSSSGSRAKEKITNQITTVDDVGEINSFLEFLDSKPNLKRNSNHQSINSNTILSKSQAEVTMNRLAGSVYGNTTDQINLSTNPSNLINHRKRSSINNSLSSKPSSVLHGLLEEDEQQQQQQPNQTQEDPLFSHSHSNVNQRSSPLSVSPGSFMNRFSTCSRNSRNSLVGDQDKDQYLNLDDDDDGEVVGKLELSYPTNTTNR